MGMAETDRVRQNRLSAFRDALQQLGWAVGLNLQFEIRWSGGDVDRVKASAEELVGLLPDVILSFGTSAITPMAFQIYLEHGSLKR
jgi:hypothetical protein